MLHITTYRALSALIVFLKTPIHKFMSSDGEQFYFLTIYFAGDLPTFHRIYKPEAVCL